MIELSLAHVSITVSLATLVILLKTLHVLLQTSYKLGVHMEQFHELKERVRVHDKILGLPSFATLPLGRDK